MSSQIWPTNREERHGQDPTICPIDSILETFLKKFLYVIDQGWGHRHPPMMGMIAFHLALPDRRGHMMPGFFVPRHPSRQDTLPGSGTIILCGLLD